MKRQRQYAAFTLVELLVVIGIIALLMSILMPAISAARESANRVKCASNLRQIGLALSNYANQNNGAFPRVIYQRKLADNEPMLLTGNWGNNDAAPFDYTRTPLGNPPNGTAPSSTWTGVNNVPAALYLLLRQNMITPDVFVCPSQASSQSKDPNGNYILSANFSNLGTIGSTNLGYSIQNPYPRINALTNGFTWTSNMNGLYPIAADMNPTDTASTYFRLCQTTSGAPSGYNYDNAYQAPEVYQQQLNSANHNKAGQNVLFADGHVEFKTTTFVGLPDSNGNPTSIYLYLPDSTTFEPTLEVVPSASPWQSSSAGTNGYGTDLPNQPMFLPTLPGLAQ